MFRSPAHATPLHVPHTLFKHGSKSGNNPGAFFGAWQEPMLREMRQREERLIRVIDDPSKGLGTTLKLMCMCARAPSATPAPWRRQLSRVCASNLCQLSRNHSS
jgi:hypothetical protein